jgi:GNAT superfamily N-acetyltransferase
MKEPHMLSRVEYYNSYFSRCLDENKNGERVTFVAYHEQEVVGYVNIIFQSAYPNFKKKSILEINDLYVVPAFRKNGVGKQLIDTCEVYATEHFYQYIGLGVGLYKDYGSAQRLYTKNGYVLDGKGLMYNNEPVSPGTNAFVDDELLLYLYKELKN